MEFLANILDMVLYAEDFILNRFPSITRNAKVNLHKQLCLQTIGLFVMAELNHADHQTIKAKLLKACTMYRCSLKLPIFLAVVCEAALILTSADPAKNFLSQIVSACNEELLKLKRATKMSDADETGL